ncbi:11677_t:CDS:1 [Funneliformis geosporum]|uniref:10749_t:CDS:1 n=1 Tax=Funneliformis geosporum TaxID=1117311 RepID=A0A9W4WM39_9GLOM|nr:11677_t:CDS:1 [Funneliformis geosporum]CAI2164108.1 10749_t:CDS:1 [Funneliformis geosporum]
MEQANKLEEDGKLRESSEIRIKNYPVTLFLKNKVNESKLEKYPREIDYYLLSEQEKKDALESEIKKIEVDISSNPSTEVLTEKLQRKTHLIQRSEKLQKETKSNILVRYLNYVSNNERL